MLRADFDAGEKLWAQDMTVNNPFNQVVKFSAGRVRAGAVTYSSFVRNIESIQIHGDTAITMGNEVVIPSGKSFGAGTTIQRRYTNIWIKRAGQWLLTTRHATSSAPIEPVEQRPTNSSSRACLAINNMTDSACHILNSTTQAGVVQLDAGRSDIARY